jgi:hypothetical protein
VVTSVSFDVDAGYAFADKEQTVLLRKLTVNGLSFTSPPAKANPAQLCRTQQQANPDGFKAHHGTNENKSNAFGKCVSKMARAVEHGTAATVQKDMLTALKATKSKSGHGKSDAGHGKSQPDKH